MAQNGEVGVFMGRIFIQHAGDCRLDSPTHTRGGGEEEAVKKTYRLKEKKSDLTENSFSKWFNGTSQVHQNHAMRKGWSHTATGKEKRKEGWAFI